MLQTSLLTTLHTTPVHIHRETHKRTARRWSHPRAVHMATRTYPKMTACQSMMLLSIGAPETPEGGSFCNLRKSRINLLLAAVDIAAFPLRLVCFALSRICFLLLSCEPLCPVCGFFPSFLPSFRRSAPVTLNAQVP